ncbi:glycosyltransferase family 2 protein [Hoeflea poritis]|uniref:Glycosyltransferase n=1 Tax=Hoeflea poritis TaxID=2993659 RepID=A0ABT4VM45_9HYPH|nr:glycosyltransferase [Hoeflea poritis]MDA4845793.1 glycosyltransferase [Hoeflea poritis]
MSYVVLTPIYEDKNACARLFRELASFMGRDIYVIAVDDGSVRQPINPDLIAEAGLEGVVLRLKRNVGHQRAIATGLSYIAEKHPDATTIVMDSDGEDAPDTVHKLLSALESPTVDAAVARRTSRFETLKFKAFYQVYRAIFRLLTGREIGFGNFMALRPSAVRRLAAMHETWIHVPASVLASKLRVEPCPIARGPRYSGQSKMNFQSLVLHGFRALMVFAEDVLVRVGLICILVMMVSVAAMLVAAVLKIFGLATPGWFSTVLGLLILILIQTGTLTLSFLMLAGIARGGPAVPVQYEALIDEVISTS